MKRTPLLTPRRPGRWFHLADFPWWVAGLLVFFTLAGCRATPLPPATLPAPLFLQTAGTERETTPAPTSEQPETAEKQFTSTPTASYTPSIPPSATQVTPTPTQTRTPAPTPTPLENAILPENATSVVEVSRLGRGRINDLAWLKSGKSLALATALGVVIYDGQSLALEKTLAGDRWFSTLAASPEGNLLAAASGRFVYIWEYPGYTLLQQFASQAGDTSQLAFSPDGKILAVVGDSSDPVIRLWDPREALLVGTLRGPKDAILSLAFRLDQKQIAAGDENATIWLWNLDFNTLDTILQGHSSGVTALAYAGKDTLVSGGSAPDGIILAWDLATGRPRYRFIGHEGTVHALDVSPSGDWAASAGTDQVIRVWDLKTGLLVDALSGHRDTVRSLAFAPAGTRLASAAIQDVRLWEIAPSQDQPGTASQMAGEIGDHLGWVAGVGFSPSGQLLAVESYGTLLRIWDATNQAPLVELAGHAGSISAVALSPDANLLLSTAAETDALVWELHGNTGTLISRLGGNAVAAWTGAWGQQSDQLAIGSYTEIRLYATGQPRPVHTLAGHTNWVTALAFSPDGSLLASASFQELWVWNTATGSRKMQLTGPKSFSGSLAFSPDGRVLAAGGGAGDPLLRLYDAATGRGLFSLEGHTDVITCLAFHPSAPILASGSKDGTLRLWRWDTGEALATLAGHTLWVSACAFNQDGTLLASGSVDGTARTWGVVP